MTTRGRLALDTLGRLASLDRPAGRATVPSSTTTWQRTDVLAAEGRTGTHPPLPGHRRASTKAVGCRGSGRSAPDRGGVG